MADENTILSTRDTRGWHRDRENAFVRSEWFAGSWYSLRVYSVGPPYRWKVERHDKYGASTHVIGGTETKLARAKIYAMRAAREDAQREKVSRG